MTSSVMAIANTASVNIPTRSEVSPGATARRTAVVVTISPDGRRV
nr:hypothetical protein [Kribbella voronezhensis]